MVGAFRHQDDRNIYAHLDVARKNKVAESLSLRLNDKGGRKMVDEERITA